MALSGPKLMDFEPSPEQRRLIEQATAFASDLPAALPKDGVGFATEAYTALGARGHFSVRATADAALIVVALSRKSAALGATFATGWLFLDTLRRHAQGDALAAVAARAEAGTLTGALAFAPVSRTDADELSASEDGAEVRFTGRTAPAPLIPVASDALIAATLRSGGGVIACVELSGRGVRKAPPSPSLGLEGLPRGIVELAGAAVPRERVLVTGDAAIAAAHGLARTRSILWAAVAVGVAGHAVDRAVSHVRSAGKLPQSTEFLVSDLATGYDAVFLSTMHAAWQRDQGVATDAAGASAKLLAARTATELCHGALGVCGESGYDEDLRRAYIDARHLELYEGAEAEQIDVIASHMLGES